MSQTDPSTPSHTTNTLSHGRYLHKVQCSWNVMAHGDAREGKWRGNWRMEWVASTLHTTSEHGVSGITTADAHTSAASSRLNWRLRRFKWTRPFRRKTKSGFCACAITFQTHSTNRQPKLNTWQFYWLLHVLASVKSHHQAIKNISRKIIKYSPVIGCIWSSLCTLIGWWRLFTKART